MDNLLVDVISIVKSALTGEKIELSADFDLKSAAKIAKKHGVIAMFYYGALNCGISDEEPLMNALFTLTCNSISLNEMQTYELSRVFKAFEEEKIEFLPVKGVLLKQLYPKAEMRSMSDADILIKTEQYDKIKPIMEKLGFCEELESDHEYVWVKNNRIYLELHKRLIPSYTKDYYAYFGDGWKLGIKTETSRYEMSVEDSFIYVFTHFAKHFRDAGIGIRHFTDLFIYLNSYPDMDEEYVIQELEKLQLAEFYLNCKKTVFVWFNNAQGDAVTDFITYKIFGSGMYGNRVSDALYKAVISSDDNQEKNAKAKTFFKVVFQPLKDMKKRYPILNKCPFLLPFMWIVRIFTAVLFRKDNIKAQKQRISAVSEENIKNYKSELDLVGLHLEFKE